MSKKEFRICLFYEHRRENTVGGMKTRWFILGLAIVPLISGRAKNALEVKVHRDRREIEIRFKERPLLVYAFATNQFKPYVRELYTLSGENVLRDSPADHLHHHGLMYAVRINGVNFWEERESPGVEKPVKLLGYYSGKSVNGLPQATFTQLIHWLAPTNRNAANSEAVALLIEKRTLRLTVNEKAGELALRWDASFKICSAGKVTLTGTDYNGLGLRLPQSFDHVAVFKNSEKSPYVGPKTRDNIPAKWTSATGKTIKGEITVALFANPGSNPVFFTLLDPFAYLSATQGLDKKPREYSASDKFGLSYLLTVYDEPKSAEFLQQRYEAWGQ